jgi:hypothetical protein
VLRIAYASDWRPVSPAPRVPGVELTDAIALRSGTALVVAGNVREVAPARARAIRIRGIAAVRRAGAWTTDIIPTSAGAAAIACAGGSAACERIEAGIAFRRGAHPYALRDLVASAGALKTTFVELAARRAVERSRLRAVATPRLQAVTATRLAGDFRAAASRLRSDGLVPRALLRALGRAAASYAALATAASRHDRAAYETARRAIVVRESEVTRRLRQLRVRGYTVYP